MANKSTRHISEGMEFQCGNATSSHPFAFSICSACLREVSVSLVPLNMRATSSIEKQNPEPLRLGA